MRKSTHRCPAPSYGRRRRTLGSKTPRQADPPSRRQPPRQHPWSPPSPTGPLHSDPMHKGPRPPASGATSQRTRTTSTVVSRRPAAGSATAAPNARTNPPGTLAPLHKTPSTLAALPSSRRIQGPFHTNLRSTVASIATGSTSIHPKPAPSKSTQLTVRHCPAPKSVHACTSHRPPASP